MGIFEMFIVGAIVFFVVAISVWSLYITLTGKKKHQCTGCGGGCSQQDQEKQ